MLLGLTNRCLIEGLLEVCVILNVNKNKIYDSLNQYDFPATKMYDLNLSLRNSFMLLSVSGATTHDVSPGELYCTHMY
jgi:hypothetical protein